MCSDYMLPAFSVIPSTNLLLHAGAANCHGGHFHNMRFSQAHYKNALLFVDNAGSDVVLGILPFARELLKLGMKVRVVSEANSSF